MEKPTREAIVAALQYLEEQLAVTETQRQEGANAEATEEQVPVLAEIHNPY
jgi:hypothetical protein